MRNAITSSFLRSVATATSVEAMEQLGSKTRTAQKKSPCPTVGQGEISEAKSQITQWSLLNDLLPNRLALGEQQQIILATGLGVGA